MSNESLSGMTGISRRIVALHKEFGRKGPSRVRTYLDDDVLGRRVLAFMSASTLEPDVLAELFVLEPEAGPGG